MSASPIDGFDRFEEAGLSVYRSRGPGPGVMLMHELPGLGPRCIELAARIAAERFTVYLPLMLGEPGDRATARHFLHVCISREFHAFALGASSPITTRLRAIGARIHRECPGPGIGVIGMCLSGGFVLSMMADARVIAGVTCQPALPMPPFGRRCAAVGVGDEDLEAAAAHDRNALLGVRFERDWLSPAARFAALADRFGRRFAVETIPTRNPFRHATLTDHYREERHRRHYDRVVTFLREQLGPSAAGSAQ